MMRIISGSYKGKKILEPKDILTRPLKDLTKESIFNIIAHSNKFNLNLTESFILDLFSGVGSFGLECLSRGAKKVVFVENYHGVLTVLKKNLTNLKNLNNYEILEEDISNINIYTKFNHKFDLIFLDPPYKLKSLDIILKNLSDKKILKKNGIIILHRHKNQKDIFPSNFNIIEEKIYGISKVLFIILN